jgi:four helix bundle suffix protein
LKDFLSFAGQKKVPIWGKDVTSPTLPDNPNFPDFPDSLPEAVNLMITLINQSIYLQKKPAVSLEKKFIEEGGFRENLFKKRLEYKRTNG